MTQNLPETRPSRFPWIKAIRSRQSRTHAHGQACDIAMQEIVKRVAAGIDKGIITRTLDSVDHMMVRVAPSWYSNFQVFDPPIIGGIYCNSPAAAATSKTEVVGCSDTEIFILTASLIRVFGQPILRIRRQRTISIATWLEGQFVLVGRRGCKIKLDADGVVSGLGDDDDQEELYPDILNRLLAHSQGTSR